MLRRTQSRSHHRRTRGQGAQQPPARAEAIDVGCAVADQHEDDGDAVGCEQIELLHDADTGRHEQKRQMGQ